MAFRLLVMVLLGMSLAVRAEASESVFPCPAVDVDHAPLHRGIPVWPHVASMMCLEGTVVLEFTVGTDGRVRDAVVLESDQPGIFDRAAIHATQTWFYSPRCEDGVPVEAQQRTALDFLFTDEERARCLPGAELLTGDALELASALGLLYSLLAEWHLNPHHSDWSDKIEAALVPTFDGDLGRVERFHHAFIGAVLEVVRSPQNNDFAVLNASRLRALQAELERAKVPLSKQALNTLRDLYTLDAEFQYQQAQYANLTAEFSRLEAEVDLHPDLLEVLVYPFVGNLRPTAEAGLALLDGHVLTEDVLDLLEDSVGEWTFQDQIVRFEDPERQLRFQRLMSEAMKWHLQRRESRHGFMLALMDYRQ